MGYYLRQCDESDPEPHPGQPPCGHESCNDVWSDLNYGERLEDWGDGECVEVYRWEVHIGIGKYVWDNHPDHPDCFEGTFDEAKEFFKSVKGKSRMWPEEEPAQKESNEDLFLFKEE